MVRPAADAVATGLRGFVALGVTAAHDAVGGRDQDQGGHRSASSSRWVREQARMRIVATRSG